MITEIILKAFITALFKNSAIRKTTDPLVEKGIQKLSAIFKKKGKDKLLSTLSTSTESPEQLAKEHSAELDQLLQDEEFRKTAHEMAVSPTVYASVVGVNVDVAGEIALKLQNNSGATADINTSVVGSNFHSGAGGFNLEING